MKKKILIVDDALFMRAQLKKILSAMDVELIEAANGQEACEHYEQDSPDLILMDISMPVMDGIDALVNIRQKNKTIPVIMCSANGQDSIVVDAIQKGVNDFIVKPFTPDKILQTVKDYLGE